MTWCMWRCFARSNRNVGMSKLNFTSFLHHLRRCSTTPKFSSHQIREKFLKNFQDQHGHKFVASSSVVAPRGEGTYFINAGMNQFKPIFLGTLDPTSEFSTFKRVVNSQKCIRVGGKHNDLDDVGKDTYHHTFFEMLGTWSFGDYFKQEACSMAWTLLTEEYGLSPDRLYVTYFAGDESLGLEADIECRDIWCQLGVAEDHILPCGARDNFWDMGDAGPCGPCTEIHYDHVGNRNASSLVNEGDPLVVELWNLVFMQYDRQTDGSLRMLPRRHIDTGMGLERLTAVLQGHVSNYDTDLFMPIIRQLEQMSSCGPYQGLVGEADRAGTDTAYRLVADHARMATVAIADGLMPGIKDQQHKLRQILHRGVRFAHEILGIPSGNFSHLAPTVIESLGSAFPEMEQQHRHIVKVISAAEKQFLMNLHQGKQAVHKLLSHTRRGEPISSQQLLELHHGRYGHPVSVDLIQEIVTSSHIRADLDDFIDEVHRRHAAENNANDQENSVTLTTHLIHSLNEHGVPATDQSHKYTHSWCDGHYHVPVLEGRVVALVRDGSLVDRVDDGDICGVIIDKSCFYAESGGQIGDVGHLVSAQSDCDIYVTDVQTYEKYILHTGHVTQGALHCGDAVQMSVNSQSRTANARNHTATHLLHNALRTVLGREVYQAGSVVSPNKLTFDFNWLGEFSNDSVQLVEEHVVNAIKESNSVHRTQMPLHEAKTIKDLVMLKDMIYQGEVWVVSVGVCRDDLHVQTRGTASVELCGGTHVHNTQHIQDFVITNVTGIGVGTKRVIAVTGDLAVQAKELSVEIKNRLDELQNAINNKEHPANWMTMSQGIDKALSVSLLPKICRDDIRSSLDRLKENINQIKNKSGKDSLKIVIEEILHNDLEKCGSVAFIEKASLKDIVKVVGLISPEKPTMLFIKPSKKLVVGVCYVPPRHDIAQTTVSFTSEAWCQHVASHVCGTVKIPHGKKTQGFHMFTTVEVHKVTEAMHCAETFLNDFNN